MLSFHLKALMQAGLVTQQRDGRSLIYRLALAQLSALLGYFSAHCCHGQPCGPLPAASGQRRTLLKLLDDASLPCRPRHSCPGAARSIPIQYTPLPAMDFQVLNLCTHHSARSVLAECMLKPWAQRLDVGLQAHSVGSVPSGRSQPPLKLHWGYPDLSCAEDGEAGQNRAFELTRQAIGYRMLQLLALPLATLDRAALFAALTEIGSN